MFTIKADAIAITKNRLDYDDTDDTLFIETLLDISVGKTRENLSQVVYRPFYVAAKELEQRFTNNLAEADGVKFLQYAKQIASLLAMQVSLDSLDNVVVPDAFDATLALADANNISLYDQIKDTTKYNNSAIFSF